MNESITIHAKGNATVSFESDLDVTMIIKDTKGIEIDRIVLTRDMLKKIAKHLVNLL